jgi:tetratricopeptide (TPR) repeat protein
MDINNKNELEQNYFVFKNKDILFFKNELMKYSKDGKGLNIEFIGCLLNFEDYTNVFNNNLITNKAEKILEYKNISNKFFEIGFLNKAKKINKRLTENYIRYISLGISNKEKIAFNKKEVKPPNFMSNEKDKIINDEENKFDDNIKDITLAKNFDVDIDAHMKKIFKNLIVFLYKLNLKDECLKYINIFLRLYLNDEKVYYFLFVIHKERGNFNMCQTVLEKIIEVYSNSEKIEEYKNELVNIKNTISQHKNDHNNYLKKMMKSINS